MTIKDKAKKAAGRARCNKCKFYLNDKRFCTPMIASVCYENYVKGFMKGYDEARREDTAALSATINGNGTTEGNYPPPESLEQKMQQRTMGGFLDNPSLNGDRGGAKSRADRR